MSGHAQAGVRASEPDVYTVEADSEEEAIEKCQRSGGEEVPGTMTYVQDVGVECYDWDAEEGA